MVKQMMQGNASEIEAKQTIPTGYKLTEVGVIPEDWEVFQLGDLSDFVTSGSRGWAKYYSTSGALFIRSQNVRDGKLCFMDSQHVNIPQGIEGGRTKVKLNDLLVTITGNSVGNVALASQEFEEAYISQHVGLVRLKDSSIGSYVCRYLSPNAPGNLQIQESQSGQSKPGLNLQNLKDFLVAVPKSKEEAKKITSALDATEALIVSLEQLIAKKQAIKTAAMQQLLTGRTRLPQFALRPDGTPKGYKSSELGKIPEDWEVLRIAELGQVDPENLGSSTVPDYEFDYVSLEQVFKGTLIGTTKMTFRNAPSRARRVLKRGDVLVSTVRPNLMSHFFVNTEVKDLICSTGFSVVRPCEGDLCPSYLYQHLFSIVINNQIEMLISGSNYPAINSTDVRQLKIQIGSFEEQTAIATILSDMDSELTALEQKLAKARDVKQGMMQQLLTGRIRLPLSKEA
ncbi:restriction endonuclease subunit S [Aeromonas veronii]